MLRSQRLSVGNIETMVDSVTDPPLVMAAIEALKPKLEIVFVALSHEYTSVPSGLKVVLEVDRPSAPAEPAGRASRKYGTEAAV